MTSRSAVVAQTLWVDTTGKRVVDLVLDRIAPFFFPSRIFVTIRRGTINIQLDTERASKVQRCAGRYLARNLVHVEVR